MLLFCDFFFLGIERIFIWACTQNWISQNEYNFFFFWGYVGQFTLSNFPILRSIELEYLYAPSILSIILVPEMKANCEAKHRKKFYERKFMTKIVFTTKFEWQISIDFSHNFLRYLLLLIFN